MPASNSDNAFDTLLSEVDGALARLNRQGSAAFQAGDYQAARACTQQGQALALLAEELAALRRRWQALLPQAAQPPPRLEIKAVKALKSSKKRRGKRAQRGLKTHQDEYRLPLLQALVELGGSSNLQPVIDRVGEIMKDTLNEYDYEPLKSDPGKPKWRNTTQWVRYSLVKEGLMKADSPVGIWQISQEGRRWLQQQR